MEGKLADQKQNQQSNKKVEKIKEAFKKVKKKTERVVIGIMILGGSVLHNSCEGEMDLSVRGVREEAPQVQVDGGTVDDHGIPQQDALSHDVSSDGSLDALQDVGKKCVSPNEVDILLKLSLDGKEEIVKVGDKVKIGNKEYTVSLSANSGDLILKGDDNEIVVVPRGKSEVVNGKSVKLVDQATDKIYFNSRVLLSVRADNKNERVIVSENKNASFKVDMFDVKIVPQAIESWDVKGNTLIAKLEVVTPDSLKVETGVVNIGKEGYVVEINSSKIEFIPIEFSTDLYPSKKAPPNLCAKTAVKIVMDINGREVTVGENSNQKIGSDVVLELGDAFISSTQNKNTSVNARITINGKNVEEGVYSVGHEFKISSDNKEHNVKIKSIDFITSEIGEY